MQLWFVMGISSHILMHILLNIILWYYVNILSIFFRHYFDPYVPIIPGIDSFPGLILHSHAYRKPDEFFGKKVLVLGAASSGIDIGIDLSNYAACVYLSHNHDR